ncbi:hypothetical protein ACGFW5_24775 [Streptomyces sp. NPDC048416]|uniref:hypothetical protein n=1 Tax=Streptomyces sp. NPDC048416 TaxID=3365546 RepID=UPI00371C54ED
MRWLPLLLGAELILSFTSPPAPAVADPAVTPRPWLHTGVTLYADSLTVRGLFCFPLPLRPGSPASCTATSMDVRRPLVLIDDGTGGVCVKAARALLTGDVHFHAAVLSGRLLGVLPVALPTSAIPPLPIPYLTLDGVKAKGVQLTATKVSLTRLDIAASAPCDG